MKLIYEASDINEANIVAAMLRAHGIEAHVGGYYLQGGVGELAAMDFANVYVQDDDVDRAGVLIAEYESEPADTETDNTNDVRIKGTNNKKLLVNFIIFVLIVISWVYLLMTLINE